MISWNIKELHNTNVLDMNMLKTAILKQPLHPKEKLNNGLEF